MSKMMTDDICRLKMFESVIVNDKEYQRVPGGLVIYKAITEIRKESMNSDTQVSTSVTSVFVPMGDSHYQEQPKFS